MQQLTKEQIQEILTHYNLGELKFHHAFWGGLSNLSYQVRTTKDRDYVLRACRQEVAVAREVDFEVAILKHLSKKNQPVPRPIQSIQGGYLLSIHLAGHDLQVIIFSYLTGMPMSYEDIDGQTFLELGQALARVHYSLSDFEYNKSKEVINLHSEIRHIKETIPRRLSSNRVGLNKAVVKKFEQCWKRTRAALDLIPVYLDEPLNYQVIHADLHHGNVLWQGRKITGLLDFEMAAYGLPILDIAITLGAWLKDAPHMGIVPAKAALVYGYQRQAQKLGQVLLSHFSVLDLLMYYYFWREMRWVLRRPENKEHRKNNLVAAQHFLPRLEQLVELL